MSEISFDFPAKIHVQELADALESVNDADIKDLILTLDSNRVDLNFTVDLTVSLLKSIMEDLHRCDPHEVEQWLAEIKDVLKYD